METEYVTISLSPAWIAALAGGICNGYPHATDPAIKKTPEVKILNLLFSDFPVELTVEGLSCKEPQNFVLDKKIAQGWASLIVDLASGLNSVNKHDEASSILVLMLPIGDASDFWNTDEMKEIGRPPMMDQALQAANKHLMGAGKIPPVSAQPKDNPFENIDKFFDFDGQGVRYGLN